MSYRNGFFPFAILYTYTQELFAFPPVSLKLLLVFSTNLLSSSWANCFPPLPFLAPGLCFPSLSLPFYCLVFSKGRHTHRARPIEGWIEEESVVLFLLFLLLPSGRANVTSEKYLRFSIDSICMLVLIEKGYCYFGAKKHFLKRE